MNKNIIKSDINKEMKSRYLDYAMSVIVGRALPDIRDGLKPVHRRILYAMYELGLSPEKGYRKCARIVGDVLGKYHPHGDTSVYDALVRMAQNFSMNHTLVDGHGNFGSIDGDSPAAMRYTEAKMDKIALEMLRDINKDTIDFIDNFDGTEKEPSVLPSRFPNLLVNGSEGIAVGMATHIPPHNLSEVINAIIYLIDNENSTIQDIMKFIPAPDFPTKGNIINTNDIYNAYSTGKGSVTIRGKYHIENNDNLKQIVFTEIPYQVNKNTLINSISKIVLKEKIFKNVIDVRDESDREGMRIVIEIKKNQNEDVILTKLFQKTSLEKKQSIILLTIVNSQPKILNLKEILNYYIEFQKEIITKRTKFDLNKAQQRLHILEGLKKATLNIDNTIKLIKNSKNKNEASNKLMTNLKIDKIQANAILELKLQRLTGLEIEILQQELNELQNRVKYLNNILENENQLLNVLKKEILEIKKKYNKPRQSEILYEHEIIEVDEEDMIEDYSTYVILTKEGYLKKLKKKSDNVKLKDKDVILKEMYSTNKSTLLLFSNKGICYKIYEYELEECKPSNLGEYLPQLLQLDKNEIIINIITTEEDYKGYLINCFKNGKIAKINLSTFKTKTKRSKLENAYNIENELINQFKIEKDIDILCQSSINKILIINTSNINAKDSKNSKGNTILKSKKDSYMKQCIPLNQIDLEQINNIEYYKGKPNSIGNFLKKEDKLIKGNILNE